mgnify:CR=1 FL=1
MTDEEFPSLSAAATQGKKKKEKKTTTKLSLQEFNDSLPDAGSSWADQTSNLPTGPSLSEHRGLHFYKILLEINIKKKSKKSNK